MKLAKITAIGAAVAAALAYEKPVMAQGLEEVIVTARRREERLQQVTVAITALGSADIEARNIDNPEQMNELIPNIDIRGGGVSLGDANFTIRGIPGVARYMDGVVLNGDLGGLESIHELERVEVLRGPQGT